MIILMNECFKVRQNLKKWHTEGGYFYRKPNEIVNRIASDNPILKSYFHKIEFIS